VIVIVVVVNVVAIMNLVVGRDKAKAPGLFEGLALESRDNHSQSFQSLLSGFFCRSYQGGNGLCPIPDLALLTFVEGMLLVILALLD